MEIQYVPMCSEELQEFIQTEKRPFFIRLIKSYKDLLYDYDKLLVEFDEELNYNRADKDALTEHLKCKNKEANREIDIYRLKIAASSILLQKSGRNPSTINKILKHQSKAVLIRYVRRIKDCQVK